MREWLGAMVTGCIVDHDREAATYHLPLEHAAFLTPAAQTNNIANAQLIPLIGNVEDGSWSASAAAVAFPTHRQVES